MKISEQAVVDLVQPYVVTLSQASGIADYFEAKARIGHLLRATGIGAALVLGCALTMRLLATEIGPFPALLQSAATTWLPVLCLMVVLIALFVAGLIDRTANASLADLILLPNQTAKVRRLGRAFTWATLTHSDATEQAKRFNWTTIASWAFTAFALYSWFDNQLAMCAAAGAVAAILFYQSFFKAD